MNNGPATNGRRATTAKVSHSLDVALADRLKRLAYVERVSESAIIEFVLREFFALGDDAALGDVVRNGALTLRRNRMPPTHEPQTVEALLSRLERDRRGLSKALELWKAHPCGEHLHAIGLCNATLVATRSQIALAGFGNVLEVQTAPVG